MPLSDTIQGGRTLLLDALAQSDVDMQFHRLLNLDMTNFPPSGIPPTINPPANQWLHAWDSVLQVWTATQPSFSDISGFLTGPQMTHIDQLGRVRVGIWEATPLIPIMVPTLDQIRDPLGNVGMAGFRLTDLAPPVNPNDAVNLAYMDFLLQGLQPKESCRVATLNSSHLYTGFGPIDGITLVEGDRVLANNDNAHMEKNGIWIAHSGAWTRSPDADTGPELERAYVTVREGTINAGTSWVQINAIVNFTTDPKNFVLFSAAPVLNVIAGNGLNKVGNTINVVGTMNRIDVGTAVNISPAYEGQNSIVKLGVVTQGTWHGDVLTSKYGGTGVDNNDFTISLGGINLALAQIGTAVPGNNLLINVPAGTVNVSLPATGTLATRDGIETLTNKRINPRTGTLLSNAKPPINIDQIDQFSVTALAVNISSMSDGITGSPVDGQELSLWIRDNGTSRTIAWGALFDASPDLTLPTVTVVNKWLFLRFVYNIIKAKWVLTLKLNNIP